jgi:hypothetical protein
MVTQGSIGVMLTKDRVSPGGVFTCCQCQWADGSHGTSTCQCNSRAACIMIIANKCDRKEYAMTKVCGCSLDGQVHHRREVADATLCHDDSEFSRGSGENVRLFVLAGLRSGHTRYVKLCHAHTHTHTSESTPHGLFKLSCRPAPITGDSSSMPSHANATIVADKHRGHVAAQPLVCRAFRIAV